MTEREPLPSVTPQDAPVPPAQQPRVSMPSPQPPARREVRVLPAPGGPNWTLVALGLLALVVAGAVTAHELTGFTPGLYPARPGVFIGAGALLVIIGLIRVFGRRRC